MRRTPTLVRLLSFVCARAVEMVFAWRCVLHRARKRLPSLVGLHVFFFVHIVLPVRDPLTDSFKVHGFRILCQLHKVGECL